MMSNSTSQFGIPEVPRPRWVKEGKLIVVVMGCDGGSSGVTCASYAGTPVKICVTVTLPLNGMSICERCDSPIRHVPGLKRTPTFQPHLCDHSDARYVLATSGTRPVNGLKGPTALRARITCALRYS